MDEFDNEADCTKVMAYRSWIFFTITW